MNHTGDCMSQNTTLVIIALVLYSFLDILNKMSGGQVVSCQLMHVLDLLDLFLMLLG